MISAPQRLAFEKTGCEVTFDSFTRRLYATDASMYQIEPAVVAFPRSAQETAAVIRTAVEHGIPVTPRGAGTGLAGGAIGDGLIVEFARFNRQISNLDLERRTVRVGAGVVLDQLNTFLKPHGFCFGPDVATSSRATFGGMIANNSSGANVPVYGVVADHVQSLDVVLADGRLATLDSKSESLPVELSKISQLVRGAAIEIHNRMPPGLPKRWPGYGVDRFLREAQLSHLLAGSEGTLAAILAAEVKIVPIPRRKTVGLIFFASVSEAMQATVALLDLKPAAIEHIDRVLFDQTRGQLAFDSARSLLELDTKPCEAILLVEFYDDDGGRLRQLSKRRLGLRTLVLEDAPSMNLVWGLRKAGLSLLTGCKGAAKPVTAIEDVAVRPEQLPAYVKGLQQILQKQKVVACFYGHAAAGLLHVRPVLDMHVAEDVQKFRLIADEVSALVREFKGSLTGEHGVGMARAEFMPEQLGAPLVQLMRDIKTVLDPKNLLNPGKILPDGRYKIDTNLRMGPGYKLELPWAPVLAFAAKDGCFTANLEQCNGCGGCRKETPSMCPTFMATGEEFMSTRGRANAIRAALETKAVEKPWFWEHLDLALSNCLSCKACTTECPSNVNMTLLKAEVTHAQHEVQGLPLSARVFGSVDLLGKIGTFAPKFANASLKSPFLRNAMEKWIGISTERPLPPYAEERFDQWFAERALDTGSTTSRGRVLLWDDTFVRYHEPHIGKAAVALLEAAGFEVKLVSGRKCCGRPAFSQGDLRKASDLGRHNLALLRDTAEPLLFLEPSCYSMFVDEYVELQLPGAGEIKKRCFLFEQFLDALLSKEPSAITFKTVKGKVAIHGHCHAKALLNPAFMKRLVERVPGLEAVLLDSGCCGMAGAFGMMKTKVELSKKIAEPLLAKVAAQPPGTIIVASGTSCRHQIEHLGGCKPKHLVEVLAEQL